MRKASQLPDSPVPGVLQATTEFFSDAVVRDGLTDHGAQAEMVWVTRNEVNKRGQGGGGIPYQLGLLASQPESELINERGQGGRARQLVPRWDVVPYSLAGATCVA